MLKINNKNVYVTSDTHFGHAQKFLYETIISSYRSILGPYLPSDKQYWSICGLCTDKDSNLLIGSELHQLIESKLITSSQFHGVEIEKEIYDKNILIPNINTNWYHGDFYQTMITNKCFNPGIVNVDTLLMPNKGASYFSNIMYIVNSRQINNVMLVWNCILKTWYHECTLENMIDALYQNSHFKSAYPNGWNIKQEAYVYSGSGEHNKTKLASIVLFKHSLI